MNITTSSPSTSSINGVVAPHRRQALALLISASMALSHLIVFGFCLEFGDGISKIITDEDLRELIRDLDVKNQEREKWEEVTDKKNGSVSYNATCCRTQDGPLKYLSITIFEKCSTDLLRDFYMDNEYRKEWDKALIEHKQLQVDETSGTEIGCIIKKFPFLTPREYILAWRVWEGKDKTFYCVIKVVPQADRVLIRLESLPEIQGLIRGVSCDVISLAQILQMVATSMSHFGSHGMFYLAAAVSDFYVPWKDMDIER